MDKKPRGLEEIVAQIKAEGMPVKRARRRWKRKPKEYEGQYTPSRAASQKAFWSTVSGTWKHLKKTYKSRAKARGEETKWLVSLTEWFALWEAAGCVLMPDGALVPAFLMRGKQPSCSRVYRIDQEKPWTLDNMVVMRNGALLANGRKVVVNSTGQSQN